MTPTIEVVIAVVALLGAFVFGVLFERRNNKLVETAVAAVKADVAKVQATLEGHAAVVTAVVKASVPVVVAPPATTK